MFEKRVINVIIYYLYPFLYNTKIYNLIKSVNYKGLMLNNLYYITVLI